MEKCIKFAVQVTLDDDMLEKLGVSLADSLVAVDKFFKKYHFTKRTSGLYFASPDMDTVQVILASSNISRDISWFKACVKKYTLLRITDSNDLIRTLK